MPPDARRVLAVSLGGLGDTVLFSPVISALRTRYPDARIELLAASPLAVELYGRAGELDSSAASHTGVDGPIANAWQLMPFARRSRKSGGYDLALLATGLNFWLGPFLQVAAGVRQIIRATSPPDHATDLACNEAVARLLVPGATEVPAFAPLTREGITEAEAALGTCGAPVLAIHPSRELPSRPRWPLANLLAVVKGLREEGLQFSCVVVGSRREGEEWRVADTENMADAVLAGDLSIAGTAALLSFSRLALCNDGGLMHLAGAVGPALVAIMPSTPASYAPPGRDVRIVSASSSSGPGGVEQITVDMVVAECADILASGEVRGQ